MPQLCSQGCEADRTKAALGSPTPPVPTRRLGADAGPLRPRRPSGSPGGLRAGAAPTFPFRIGRQAGLELVLPSYVVSKVHAELYQQEGRLRSATSGSRNGTFVNRKTVQDAAIAEGD